MDRSISPSKEMASGRFAVLARDDVIKCLFAIMVVAGFAPWFTTSYMSEDLSYSLFSSLLGPEYPGHGLYMGALVYCSGLVTMFFGQRSVRFYGWVIMVLGIVTFLLLGRMGPTMTAGLGMIFSIICLGLLLPEAIRSKKMEGEEITG